MNIKVDGDKDTLAGLFVNIMSLNFSHNEVGSRWSALNTKV